MGWCARGGGAPDGGGRFGEQRNEQPNSGSCAWICFAQANRGGRRRAWANRARGRMPSCGANADKGPALYLRPSGHACESSRRDVPRVLAAERRTRQPVGSASAGRRRRRSVHGARSTADAILSAFMPFCRRLHDSVCKREDQAIWVLAADGSGSGGGGEECDDRAVAHTYRRC